MQRIYNKLVNKNITAVNDACFNREWKQTLLLEDVTCMLQDRLLFEPITVSLQAGQGLEVRGPNGVGKTTLLNAIVGMKSYIGQIHWTKDQRAFDKPAYLGHEQGFHPYLSVLENLRYTQVVPQQKMHQYAVLEEVGLLQHAQTLYSALSKGQQRRLGMAFLRLHPSPLWVLDEPFTHLDPTAIASLQCGMIQHLQDGGILIVSSHQPINLLDKQLSLCGVPS